MTDDEPLAPVAPAADDARYPETLLYDFSKYLASLSVLVLGGVLTFAQLTPLGAPAERQTLTIVLACVMIAGIVALSIASTIVDARIRRREPPRRLRVLMTFALISLGAGIGMFMSAWLDQ